MSCIDFGIRRWTQVNEGAGLILQLSCEGTIKPLLSSGANTAVGRMELILKDQGSL